MILSPSLSANLPSPARLVSKLIRDLNEFSEYLGLSLQPIAVVIFHSSKPTSVCVHIPHSHTHTHRIFLFYSFSLSPLMSGAMMNAVIKEGKDPLSFRAQELEAEKSSGKMGSRE